MVDAPQNRRRRWTQFGLGTMLAVLTAMAAWLGLAAEHIRARKSMREWITSNRGMIVTGAESPTFFDPPPRTVKIPIWSCWLGDEAIAYVWMPKVATDSDWAHARPLFPEALWMDEISFDWISSDQARPKLDNLDTDRTSGGFLTILMTKDEQQAFEDAAKRAGVSMPDWGKNQLNKAALRQP